MRIQFLVESGPAPVPDERERESRTRRLPVPPALTLPTPSLINNTNLKNEEQVFSRVSARFLFESINLSMSNAVRHCLIQKSIHM